MGQSRNDSESVPMTRAIQNVQNPEPKSSAGYPPHREIEAKQIAAPKNVSVTAVSSLGSLSAGCAQSSFPVSPERLRAGIERDNEIEHNNWFNFLAGDDMPVGSDALP